MRAAQEQLHAASAQIGVATANMLPNLTISANAGYINTVLAGLLSPANAFWLVAGNAAQTVFDGGTLLHSFKEPRTPITRRRGAIGARWSAPYRTWRTACARCKTTPTR